MSTLSEEKQHFFPIDQTNHCSSFKHPSFVTAVLAQHDREIQVFNPKCLPIIGTKSPSSRSCQGLPLTENHRTKSLQNSCQMSQTWPAALADLLHQRFTDLGASNPQEFLDAVEMLARQELEDSQELRILRQRLRELSQLALQLPVFWVCL